MTRKKALARLGLHDGASADDIKRAYRKLAFELHPDLHPENPEAGKDFQLLNEAYVFLSSAPEPGGSRSRRSPARESQAEATEKARADARKAYDRARKRFQDEETGAGKGSGAGNASASGTGARDDREKVREMERDEVLRDLLRDPFARRVFEDIYSRIREEAVRKRKGSGTAGSADKSGSGPGFIERTADNVSEWFRRQIDEEQTVRVAGPLTPGKRIRFQIHHGVFGKSQTIELTLPPGFTPGRPLRLKGMGKRIGKWQGDLYLRIVNQ